MLLLLKLKVDLWNSSMEIISHIIDNKTGKARKLPIVFDTGAYLTIIHDKTLLRAGYNVNKASNATINVVGRKNVPAKELLLRGFVLEDIEGNKTNIGPVWVYSTDMSDAETDAVLGLNVIKEFETKITFGQETIIELTPTYDINDKVKYENFNRTESRFGLWVPSQIK